MGTPAVKSERFFSELLSACPNAPPRDKIERPLVTFRHRRSLANTSNPRAMMSGPKAQSQPVESSSLISMDSPSTLRNPINSLNRSILIGGQFMAKTTSRSRKKGESSEVEAPEVSERPAATAVEDPPEAPVEPRVET